MLWFAWKFVPLWYQQQLQLLLPTRLNSCDLLENSYLCGISNNITSFQLPLPLLWFAWKFVPLWYQQQLQPCLQRGQASCDLLENSYLCGISNNRWDFESTEHVVVICLKIRTFVVSATTLPFVQNNPTELWFAWKFVPLWYQQQQPFNRYLRRKSCDLLENSYLCGISNNRIIRGAQRHKLWFAWKFVPLWYQQQPDMGANESAACCDLLENSYLCGISNNKTPSRVYTRLVVICLKIRTFVVSATTHHRLARKRPKLWFAWKFVPLWYQQQHIILTTLHWWGCDLLENSYLCGISNNPIGYQ